MSFFASRLKSIRTNCRISSISSGQEKSGQETELTFSKSFQSCGQVDVDRTYASTSRIVNSVAWIFRSVRRAMRAGRSNNVQSTKRISDTIATTVTCVRSDHLGKSIKLTSAFDIRKAIRFPCLLIHPAYTAGAVGPPYRSWPSRRCLLFLVMPERRGAATTIPNIVLSDGVVDWCASIVASNWPTLFQFPMD